jgi:thiol-disulfide isomerase/thioredoxin
MINSTLIDNGFILNEVEGNNNASNNSEIISKTIVSGFENRQDFLSFLSKNTGMIVIRFSASWCKPCKKIKPIVDCFFASSPNCVTCVDLDIDENTDVYSFLKSRKMIYGVPTLMCYSSINKSFIPDFSISGGAPEDLDKFFKACGKMALKYSNTFQHKEKENFTLV